MNAYSDWADTFCDEHNTAIKDLARRLDATSKALETVQTALMWISVMNDEPFIIPQELVDEYSMKQGNLSVSIEPLEDDSVMVRVSVATFPELDDL